MRCFINIIFYLFLNSNFRLERYIWYQSRDFNDFMGSLGSEPIVLICVCIVLPWYEIKKIQVV